MEWKRTKVVIHIWDSNGFKITEDADGEGKPFRLESPDADPEWFADLDTAKAVATLQNRLALIEEDNQRLRDQLDQKNGVWPVERLPTPEDFDDDERDIPTSKPEVDAIAAELNTVMALNGQSVKPLAILNADRFAEAGPNDIPF